MSRDLFDTLKVTGVPVERAYSIKGLPLGDLSVTAIASVIDVYEDPETGNQIPEIEMEVLHEKDWEAFNAPKSEASRCALCGHSLKIACAVTHRATGNGYWIGRDCARTVAALAGFEGIIKGATVALAQRIACEKREATFLAAHPDAIGVIQWSKRPNASRISRDIVEKLRRYGSISEKQLAVLEKVRQADIDRRASATGTAKAGRQVIQGVVRKVTLVERERLRFAIRTHYTAKILVDLGNGVRLYGNCPECLTLDAVCVGRALEGLSIIGHQACVSDILKVGDTVEFKASVEPKADDPLFGFWKRPADFKILKLAVDEQAIAKANPVLAEPDYQAKLAKWNALNDEARSLGLPPEQAAKWIAERMKADICTINPETAATCSQREV
jgi:hypothetical protein